MNLNPQNEIYISHGFAKKVLAKCMIKDLSVRLVVGSISYAF